MCSLPHGGRWGCTRFSDDGDDYGILIYTRPVMERRLRLRSGAVRLLVASV
jgi:hypothetical protein